MDSDLVILVIGAIIGGIMGILGSIVGYYVNHFLKLKEQKVVREFEIREKGRDFFHQIYGLVAILSDFAISILQKNSSGKAMILVESGYTMQPIAEIIKRYKKAYEERAKFWFEARKNGLEVFLPKDLAKSLADFWAYAGYFYEQDDWERDVRLLGEFEVISRKICETIDRLLGLTEKNY